MRAWEAEDTLVLGGILAFLAFFFLAIMAPVAFVFEHRLGQLGAGVVAGAGAFTATCVVAGRRRARRRRDAALLWGIEPGDGHEMSVLVLACLAGVVLPFLLLVLPPIPGVPGPWAFLAATVAGAAGVVVASLWATDRRLRQREASFDAVGLVQHSGGGVLDQGVRHEGAFRGRAAFVEHALHHEGPVVRIGVRVRNPGVRLVVQPHLPDLARAVALREGRDADGLGARAVPDDEGFVTRLAIHSPDNPLAVRGLLDLRTRRWIEAQPRFRHLQLEGDRLVLERVDGHPEAWEAAADLEAMDRLARAVEGLRASPARDLRWAPPVLVRLP